MSKKSVKEVREEVKEEENQEVTEKKKEDKTSSTTKTTTNRRTKKRSTSTASGKTKPKEKKIDLSAFISNPEGNIYAVTNLPEEFIATLFAWVSRSPKSFKDHVKQAIVDFDIKPPQTNVFDGLNKKAYDFHKKWTVGYGHSSVAENAVAHVGVEEVSRLASHDLELSNDFLSITEYSQRYQKPKRGDWHNPIDKENKSLYEEVEAFFNQSFTVFENLIEAVHTHLDNKIDKKLSIKERNAQSRANLKLAFEDARYVLPLAMHTQLGMTANGRAWRDALAKLDLSDYKEVHQMKEDLKTEITKVLPVLLRYADASDYQKKSKRRKRAHFGKAITSVNIPKDVSLIEMEPEYRAIIKILAHFFIEESDLSYDAAEQKVLSMNSEERSKKLKEVLYEMKHFDTPPEAFRSVHYQIELLVSEANWHQLLRHNRKTHFTFYKPSPFSGVVVPPRIKEAGLEDLVYELDKEAQALFNKINKETEDRSADYVVLNAHKRRVIANFDLWEAYHLINLRTSDEAQWDIKNTFNELHDLLKEFHPLLVSTAKRRD